MANLTLGQRFEMCAKYLESMLKLYAPKRTGNLYLNAIRIEYINTNEAKLVIGGEVAPYAIYTNGHWDTVEYTRHMPEHNLTRYVKDKNGKVKMISNHVPAHTEKVTRTATNKNEGWVQKAIHASESYIQQIMSGSLSQDDILDRADEIEGLAKEDWQQQYNQKFGGK